MKVNRDLLIAVTISVFIHAVFLFSMDSFTTPAEYSVRRAPSSVEVTLVKKQREKKRVEKKTESPEPEPAKDAAENKAVRDPEKKKAAQGEKPEKKVVKNDEPEKKPEPVEEPVKKEELTEKNEPESAETALKKEITEKTPDPLVNDIEVKRKQQAEKTQEKSGTPVRMPAYLENEPPKYPEIARKRGFEGKVLIRVRVLSSGNPEELEIIDSSGYEILDQAALQAISRWKFKPATQGGKAIDSWVEIPIRFELRDT